MKNMNDSCIRTALVGCGTISQNHLTTLSSMTGVKVVALCDVKPERAEKRRAEFAPEAKIYTDFLTMLDTENPDVLHVCTPHYLHADMTIAALERGIHVFLEKPMATTEEDARRILEAERKSGKKLTVCFQNRYNPATLLAKEICERDGGVLGAFGAVFWHRNAPYYTESGWRGSYATEGGGVMINQAIHTIDLLCEFLGTPVSVTATKANHHLKGVIEVEDSCEGVIRFDSGKCANFYATTSAEAVGDSTEVYLKTEHHTVELRSPFVILDNKEIIEAEKAEGYVTKACYGNSHRYMIETFYGAVRGECEVPVTAESALDALKILLAAYRSGDSEIKL